MDDPRDDAVRPVDLRTHEDHGGGFVGTPRPTLRWRLEAARGGVRQEAFAMEVARDPGFIEIAASTGIVAASAPVGVPWPGEPLASRGVRWVRVRVRTDIGWTGWSATLRVEAALLDAADWTARPISPVGNVDRTAPGPVPLLRHRFHIDRTVASARLYITAFGIQQAWLNGAPIGDALLEPGWTAYRDRLLYAAHDVTDAIIPGENVLAAAVGDGWWRGWLTWMRQRNVYGTTTALLAQLEIHFTDGTSRIIASDEAWRGGTGAWTAADLYDGCETDLRSKPDGWRNAGFDDRAWTSVVALPFSPAPTLRPMPPVRIVERWSVASLPRGERHWKIDTGQNLAGYLRLRVRGTAGTTIRVRHAEVLDDDGGLYTAPLRDAKATDTYVLAEVAATWLEPIFTFHGFRYAEIVADGDVAIEAVEVCAIASAMAEIGTFACSDARVNRLFDNVRWSQRGNFVTLPTDCPQRDERMGWTGDIQVFADTACTNTDAATFLGNWLRDLAAEQRHDGNVPATVPNVVPGFDYEYGGVGWGDAATLVPWSLYEAYGDAQVLAEQFDSMCRWVDYGLSRRGGDGTWSGDFHLGDWLDPAAPSDHPHLATTDRDFIATAYLSRSATIVGRAARVLGDIVAAARYDTFGRELAAAAWTKWGNAAMTTQTGCAIALRFGIVPDDDTARVAAALAALVERADGRIATGFLGTPLVLPALSDHGWVDTAYQLLLNDACPGWLYQVARGATTMWERWDAVREDGSLHTGDMAVAEGASMISFNHYAYGAVAAWLYRSVAGIAPDAPGYATIRFAPRPGGGLTSASARVQTPYGWSGIAWRIDADGGLTIELEIAAGAVALFDPPRGWEYAAGDRPTFGSGRHSLWLARA